MVRNLAKTPLMAVIYASLLEFAVVFLPFSESYKTAMHQFDMPFWGHLFLIAYGLLISVILAVIFGSMDHVGVLGAIMTTLTLIGYQWVIPALKTVWYGDRSGLMATSDLLFLTGARVLCTILLVVLAMLLFGKKPEVKSGAKPETKPASKEEKKSYKLGVLGLVIRMIALPIIYILLYLPTWYFLGWNSEIIRAYYGSTAIDEGFVAAVVNLLLSDGGVLLYCLLAGLVSALLALPLMTRIPGKRLIFMASIVLLSISPALLRLLPTPLLSDDVRIKLLIQEAVLSGVYGILCSLLLHISYKKQTAQGKKESSKPDEGQPASPKGPTPKQQANAVRMTMAGK